MKSNEKIRKGEILVFFIKKQKGMKEETMRNTKQIYSSLSYSDYEWNSVSIDKSNSDVILNIRFKKEYSEIAFAEYDEADFIMKTLAEHVYDKTEMMLLYDRILCELWIDIHSIPQGYSLNKIKEIVNSEPNGISELVIVELTYLPNF